MRPATKTVTAVTGTVAIVFLALAMGSAQATPQLAKGKACTTCHTAMPATKDNVKEDAKKDGAKKEEEKKK